MEKASEGVLALRPVTFRYKPEIDPERAPQFGLVAEEVEKVNPALVTRGPEGSVFTVRYEAVNAMLLNEFLKEHRKVGELERIVAQQRKDFEAAITRQQKDFYVTAERQQAEIESFTAQLKEQATQLQKVNAQLNVSKSTSQIAVNDQ